MRFTLVLAVEETVLSAVGPALQRISRAVYFLTNISPSIFPTFQPLETTILLSVSMHLTILFRLRIKMRSYIVYPVCGLFHVLQVYPCCHKGRIFFFLKAE